MTGTRIAIWGTIALLAGTAVAQQASVVVKQVSGQKFAVVPNAPACSTGIVEQGDPSKEPSFMLMRSKAGCTVPWHWHPATETIMLVRGTAKVEMKDSPAVVLAEGYLSVPPKHAMRFRCVTEYELFLHTDGPFEIHYVDDQGNEISPEAALYPKK